MFKKGHKIANLYNIIPVDFNLCGEERRAKGLNLVRLWEALLRKIGEKKGEYLKEFKNIQKSEEGLCWCSAPAMGPREDK